MSVDLSALAGHIAILRHVADKKAELKKLEDNSKAAIQEAMGDDEIGKIGDEVVVSWTTSKRVALDQKAFKEAEPDTHALYCTTTEVRRFSVKDAT